MRWSKRFKFKMRLFERPEILSLAENIRVHSPQENQQPSVDGQAPFQPWRPWAAENLRPPVRVISIFHFRQISVFKCPADPLRAMLTLRILF